MAPWRLSVVLLIWAALGFDQSWKKGQKGPRVESIGGEIDLLRDGVAVQLTEAKTQGAKDNIGLSVMLVKKLVSFMGYTSWNASVAPVATPFVSMLWREHSQITPRGRRRETQLGSGLGSLSVSNAFHTLSDGFARCRLGVVHFGEHSR